MRETRNMSYLYARY